MSKKTKLSAECSWGFICSFQLEALVCYIFLPFLEVSKPVFGLIWLPSERQEGQGPSLSLLRPPLQGGATECAAEVPQLAARSEPVSWIKAGAGTGVAGVFSCALRSLLSPGLLLISSPSWGDYECRSATDPKQFYESMLFSMRATCQFEYFDLFNAYDTV